MKDMNQFPEWLQELYEINPRIARKAELDFNTMADMINSPKNSQASNPLESCFNDLIHSLGAPKNSQASNPLESCFNDLIHSLGAK